MTSVGTAGCQTSKEALCCLTWTQHIPGEPWMLCEGRTHSCSGSIETLVLRAMANERTWECTHHVPAQPSFQAALLVTQLCA